MYIKRVAPGRDGVWSPPMTDGPVPGADASPADPAAVATGLRKAGSTLWRAGLLDPTLTVPLGGAVLWWGPNPAAVYSAIAARHPLRRALVDDHGSLTYLQLAVRTDGVAASLRSRGVRRGDAVGLACRNHRGFVESLVVLAKLGARPVHLNTGLSAGQLGPVVAREGVSLVICDRDLVPVVAEAAPGIERVVAAPEDDPRWSFPELPRRRVLIRLPSPGGDSDPVILTSGTTGVPKGARRSGRSADLPGTIGLLEALPYRRGDVVVITPPLFHAWGLGQLLLTASLAGTVVLRRRFDATRAVADVVDHAADVLVVVPVMAARMLEVAGAPRLDGLRIVASSGGPLPGDLATRWMDAHGDTLHNLYGSTEVGPVAIAGPADLRRSATTAGRPPAGVEMRIVDDAGHPVAPGEIGRIVVRSRASFDGYTGGGSRPVVDGFMDIGDTGFVDPTGLLHVVGRSDDMIVSGGENLYPGPVEDVLTTHPDVSEAAVVGVPDDELGMRVRAFVVAAGDAAIDTDVIRRFCRDRLASHEVPRDVVVVDHLPRNETGKVLRRRLVDDDPGADRGTDTPTEVTP